MAYVTPEQIAKAKEMDLLTYLQNYEPQELIHVAGNTYCTREHDSLKISNGKWNWFSRGIGGRTALDYLIKVRDIPFPQAVEILVGRAAALPPISHAPEPEDPRELLMPELNSSASTVVKYLMGRGIHPTVLDYCLSHDLLFETKQYHNALFVGYDSSGQMRYAALRGTWGNFKGEVSGSDKHFSFAISAQEDSSDLHLFESAIDLMSYASLAQMAGQDWRKTNLLSLAGVYLFKRENVVPVALSQYLSDHPHIKQLYLHLDNDAVGRGAAAGIMGGLKDRCEIYDQPPRYGNDVNELLQIRLGRCQRKEALAR